MYVSHISWFSSFTSKRNIRLSDFPVVLLCSTCKWGTDTMWRQAFRCFRSSNPLYAHVFSCISDMFQRASICWPIKRLSYGSGSRTSSLLSLSCCICPTPTVSTFLGIDLQTSSANDSFPDIWYWPLFCNYCSNPIVFPCFLFAFSQKLTPSFCFPYECSQH